MRKKRKNFEGIAEEWLEYKRISVKYTTFVKYKEVITVYIIPFFKETPKVNDQSVLKFMNRMQNEEQLSPSTLNTIKYIVQAILKYGETKYKTDHIDLSYIQLPKGNRNNQIPTTEQEQCLRQHCLNTCNSTSVAILLGLYMGLRIGEICALQWKDINFKDCTLSITKTAQRVTLYDGEKTKTSLMLFEPKTNTSKRTVPVHKVLIQYLEEYNKSIINPKDDFFILTNTEHPQEPRTLEYQFKRVCEKYKISLKFHSLRHCFATRCVEAGIDIKSLSEILGHANISITLERYMHSSMQFKQEQINKLQL